MKRKAPSQLSKSLFDIHADMAKKAKIQVPVPDFSTVGRLTTWANDKKSNPDVTKEEFLALSASEKQKLANVISSKVDVEDLEMFLELGIDKTYGELFYSLVGRCVSEGHKVEIIEGLNLTFEQLDTTGYPRSNVLDLLLKHADMTGCTADHISPWVESGRWKEVAKLAAVVNPVELRRAFYVSESKRFMDVKDEAVLKAVFDAVTIEDILEQICASCYRCDCHHYEEDPCGFSASDKKDVVQGQDVFDVKGVPSHKKRFEKAAANPTLIKLWISMGMVKHVDCFVKCLEEKNPATLPLLLEELHTTREASYLRGLVFDAALLKEYAAKFSLEEIIESGVGDLCVTLKESLQVLIERGLKPEHIAEKCIRCAVSEADIVTLEFLRDWGVNLQAGFCSSLDASKLRLLKDSKVQLPVLTAKDIEFLEVDQLRVLIEWGMSRDVLLSEDNLLIRNAFRHKKSEMIDFLYSVLKVTDEEFCKLGLDPVSEKNELSVSSGWSLSSS